MTDPTKETSPVEESSSLSASMSHVSLKPPPFYHKSPSTWFRQMESQFHLSKITNTATKFHHVLAALPEQIACDVPLDGIDEDYSALKKAVIDSLSANKHELIDQALSAVPLGDKRPTAYVNELKRKFAEVGLAPEDAIIRSRLLSALPANIRAALVGHDKESLESFARIADSMMAVAGIQNTPYHVGHVGADNRFRGDPGNNAYNANSSYNGNNGNNAYNASNANNRRTGYRPFYRDQRPKVCNAHIFYGERARTCRHWCRWPNKPQHILQRGEKTPAQSRSNSPDAKNA